MKSLLRSKIPQNSKVWKSEDTREPTLDTSSLAGSFCRSVHAPSETKRQLHPNDHGEEFSEVEEEIPDETVYLLEEITPESRPGAKKLKPVSNRVYLASIGLRLPPLNLKPTKKPDKTAVMYAYAQQITAQTTNKPQTLSDRGQQLKQLIAKLETAVFELRRRYKSEQDKEPAAKGNLTKLIQISFEKRRIKLSLEDLDKQIVTAKAKLTHVQSLAAREQARNTTYDILGISNNKAGTLLRKSWNKPLDSPASNYFDKQLDKRELSAIRKGLSLRDAFPEPVSEGKIDFGIQDRVFLKDRILSAQKERAWSFDTKQKEAFIKKGRHLEEVRAGILNRKLLRSKGVFEVSRDRSLYPERLTDSSMQPFLELRKLESDSKRSKQKLDRLLSGMKPILRVSEPSDSMLLTLQDISSFN